MPAFSTDPPTDDMSAGGFAAVRPLLSGAMVVVVLTEDGEDAIWGEGIQTVHGALVINDGEGKPVAAFAPGQWLSAKVEDR